MIPEIVERQADVEALCHRFQVKRLEVFGSAVTEDFRPGGSDLDFLVEFETATEGGYADRYFGPLEALTELFGRPIDLIVASAIRNPFFRESIERNKALLYAS